MFSSGGRWKKHAVPGGGECLFESVRLALGTIGYVYRVNDLRHVVAKRVLDEDDAEMNEVLRIWMQLFQEATKSGDLSVLAECWQVRPTTRQGIFRNMMSSSFWGEQISLQTLQQALRCRFLIVSVDNLHKTPLPMQPVAMQSPVDTYILLFLQDNHYRPMSHDGRFVFLGKTLPADAMAFFAAFM
jgi:hypothetical protein